MLRHLNTHRETGKNVSSLSEAPFVASCSQQMTLLLTVAEFVKMKRQHLHLMSHGNGNGCCGIWTHPEKQPKTWAVCPTLRSLHHVRNKSNRVACMKESSQNTVAKKSEPLPKTFTQPTASFGNPVRHPSRPSAVSATPATQSEGQCRQVPRLPRKVTIDVTKCHACHAKSRGGHGVIWEPGAPPEPAQCRKCHACHAKWASMSPSEDACRQVPRLPRKVTLDVTKCHACHAKWQSMSPSATPATQRAAASTASFGDPARHQSRKCHACHAKWASMSPSEDTCPPSATPTTQSEGPCRQVPRLPRKVTVDVTKCHACHAKKPRRPRRHLGTRRVTRAGPVP